MPYRLLLLLLVLFLFASNAGAELPAGQASHPGKPPGIDALVGESHLYHLSFLWFDELARGRLLLTEGERPGTFRAVIEAETLGLAAWISGHEVRRYMSLMELGSDGRLRPLRHEVHRIKGRGARREDHAVRYLFDDAKGEIRYQEARNGAVFQEALLPVTGTEMPSDILTVFYNLRIGAFGRVTAGNRYVIPMLARREISPMVVEVLPPSENPRRDFFPENGRLSRVLLDRKIFDTGGGWVYVWFDGRGRPARGLIENVIGLGDVRGRIGE